MGDYVLKVEKLANGYECEVYDDKIDAANQKPKAKWQDPWVGYAFKNVEEVKNFIGEHLDSLKPPPDADAEYKTAFKQQTEEE